MGPGSERQKGTGRRICIAGTGGQGVLTAARLLCDTLVEKGHEVVSGQLHGMAQRGGSVQSSVIIDCGISPVIPSGKADVVLGFEPVETARALPVMSARTLVYMNTAPVIPYVLGQQFVLKEGNGQYPKVEDLTEAVTAVTPLLFTFDATRCAVQAGSARALNIVMLGWLFGSGALPYNADDFWNSASSRMPPRLRETNNRAFLRGLEVGRNLSRGGERP